MKKTVTRKDVNDERTLRLSEVFTFKIDGVGPIAIKVTNEAMVTLLNLATTALIRIAKAEVDVAITFRDEENRNISLNPAQVLELFELANLQIQDIMEASWLIKDDTELPETLHALKNDPRWL